MISELLVQKDRLGEVESRVRPLPELQDGEVLLEVESFGLTANNVTYGLVGEQIGYWKFFPAPGAEGKGIIPVWGFGRVIASNSDELREGERLYGYFPMASHLVMVPKRTGGGVNDMAEHRQALPPLYNNYRLTAEEPAILKGADDARSVLFPLFATSFIIVDWLKDNDYFGAEQIVVASASSKTGFGVGAILRQGQGDRPKTIGLTSPGNRSFVENLNVFDDVLDYDSIGELNDVPTAFIDMAGNARIITAVHNHLGNNVKVSSIVGATHWEAPRQAEALPGAKPTMFFAPAQVAKRDKELGPGAFMGQAVAAWAAAARAIDGKFAYDHIEGVDAAMEAWRQTVAGKVPPSRGLVVTLSGGAA